MTDGFAIINNQIIHYHQIIHYELETDNIYFGSTFYVKNGVIYPLNKDTEIMLDTCILNVKNRTIYDPNSTLPVLSIDEPCQSYNALVTILANEFKNKKIKIEKNKETGGHNVFADSIKIASEHDGKITELNLPTTEKIGEYFLFRNKDLESFNAPKLTQVGRCFLYSNTKLKNLNTPKLTIVGYGFLNENEELTSLNLPSLKEAGSCFLCKNTKLKSLYLPNLEYFENILSDRIELEAWIVSKTVKECFLSDVLSMQNPPQIKLNSSSSAQKDNKNSFDLKKTQLQRKRNNQR